MGRPFFFLLRFFPFFSFSSSLFFFFFFWNATAYFAQFAIRDYAPVASVNWLANTRGGLIHRLKIMVVTKQGRSMEEETGPAEVRRM